MSLSDVRAMNNQTPLHMSCGGSVSWSANLDIVWYLVERAHCDVSELLLQYKYLKQLNVHM